MTPPALPSLPGLSWARHKKPGFSTRVASHASGREVRVALMSFPLYEFEAAYNGLSSTASPPAAQTGLGASSLQSLMGFFLQLLGQAGVFLYTDPDDNTVAGQNIGVGDGVTQCFAMGRTLGGFNEPVSWVAAIANVYLNGSVQPGGNYVLEPPNTLAFYNAPGAGVAITADFTFAFQCRFLDDQMDFEEFMSSLWKLGSMKFRSVKANTTPAAAPPWYDQYAIGGAAPTLFADFTTEGAADHYFYNGSTYAGSVAWLAAIAASFSRASTAYYTNASGLLASAANNALRFDYDPVALTPKGILLEGASTNLNQYSNSFTTFSWWQRNGGISVATSTALAPDGASPAFTITPPAGTAITPYLESSASGMTVSAGATITASYYLKYLGAQFCAVGTWDGPGGGYKLAVFDLINGVVGNVASGIAANIYPAPQGYFRCTVTRIMVGTAFYSDIYPRSSNAATASQTFAGTETVTTCFAQAELLPFASSYIPTTSSTATRSADNLYLPWTAATFTARVKAKMLGEDDNGRLLDAGASGLLYETSGPNTTTNNATNSLSTGVNAWASENIIVVGGSSSGRVLSANGNVAISDSNALVPFAPSDIYVGQQSGGSNYGYGDFAQIGLWTVAATAAQAVALSDAA